VWIDSDNKKQASWAKKIDTTQTIFESNHIAPNEGLYDSKDLWIDSTRKKARLEETSDMNQTNFIRYMNDMIHQFMNRFKMH